jgi:voltage-gated potassium channel
MRKSWRATLFGPLFLGLFFVVAATGYRQLAGYSWLDAVWMVVVTVSSVGFGERSTLPPAAKIWTIAVIAIGMSSAAYFLGGFVRFVMEGEIQRTLGRRRMTKDIKNLSNHVVVCGFGRIGRELCEHFHRRNLSFLVIELEDSSVEAAAAHGYLTIQGDATDDELLHTAGVQRAKTLVTTLPNDAENVFITLTARNLNSTLHIISRAELPTTASKLRQAGANKVVLPTMIGAQKMAQMVTRPASADLIDLVAEQTFLDVELDEFTVSQNSRLIGVTVRNTEASRRHGLLVVGIKKPAGEIIFNPGAEYTFCDGDVVVAMGRLEDMARFAREYEV